MKFPRKYFNIQLYSQRSFHESVTYQNASSFWSFARRKKAGLLFVPAKPLALEPHTTAAVPIKDLLKKANRPLQFYNVSPDWGQNHFPRLALALIDDLARLDQLGVHSLQSLPAKYKTSIIDQFHQNLDRFLRKARTSTQSKRTMMLNTMLSIYQSRRISLPAELKTKSYAMTIFLAHGSSQMKRNVLMAQSRDCMRDWIYRTILPQKSTLMVMTVSLWMVCFSLSHSRQSE